MSTPKWTDIVIQASAPRMMDNHSRHHTVSLITSTIWLSIQIYSGLTIINYQVAPDPFTHANLLQSEMQKCVNLKLLLMAVAAVCEWCGIEKAQHMYVWVNVACSVKRFGWLLRLEKHCINRKTVYKYSSSTLLFLHLARQYWYWIHMMLNYVLMMGCILSQLER